MVQAVGSFEEKAAIFCTPVRSVYKSAIEDKLIYSQNGKRGISLSLVVEICRVTQTLILTLECFLLIDCHRQYATILAEVFEASQSFLLGHIW